MVLRCYVMLCDECIYALISKVLSMVFLKLGIVEPRKLILGSFSMRRKSGNMLTRR